MSAPTEDIKMLQLSLSIMPAHTAPQGRISTSQKTSNQYGWRKSVRQFHQLIMTISNAFTENRQKNAPMFRLYQRRLGLH